LRSSLEAIIDKSKSQQKRRDSCDLQTPKWTNRAPKVKPRVSDSRTIPFSGNGGLENGGKFS
jgi:hypothetical protein